MWADIQIVVPFSGLVTLVLGTQSNECSKQSKHIALAKTKLKMLHYKNEYGLTFEIF